MMGGITFVLMCKTGMIDYHWRNVIIRISRVDMMIEHTDGGIGPK